MISRDGPLLFLEGGGGEEKLFSANIFLKNMHVSANIFFPSSSSCKQFFSFFSVFFFFVLNITIALF